MLVFTVSEKYQVTKSYSAGCVPLHQGQMIVSFVSISAKSLCCPPHTHTHTPTASVPHLFSYTHHSWFVLDRGHILFTSSTLNGCSLYCCAASCPLTPRMSRIPAFPKRKTVQPAWKYINTYIYILKKIIVELVSHFLFTRC